MIPVNRNSARITLADIQAAVSRIRGRVLETPLRRSEPLSARLGCEVLLKLETLQPTFSYKVRGAINAVERHVQASGTASLVTASAGNHGRALAFATAARGVPLTVYVPENAPRTKVEAIRALGADLRLCRNYDEAEHQAKAHAANGSGRFISPYSHPDVIAGAGTGALEILAQSSDVATIVVPIGGGGLISGIALAAEQSRPQLVICGVEAEASQPFTRGRAAGHIVEVTVSPTLADGLAGNLDPDTLTFDIVQRLVPEIVTVSEAGIRGAMHMMVQQERIIVEGAGAVGVAALLAGKVKPTRGAVAIVVSGANIDADVLRSIL